MFQVISDLFRDGELSGLSKALWIVFLIFLPLLTSLVYLLVRGKGMGQRQRVAVEKAMSETDAYIRQVAGKSPADQIDGSEVRPISSVEMPLSMVRPAASASSRMVLLPSPSIFRLERTKLTAAL